MRPIEFRAWDKKEKRMIYFDLSELFYGDEIDGLTDTYANYVFMQYTGLQDKNGEKIFEGDVCQSGIANSTLNIEGVVEYFVDGFCIADNLGQHWRFDELPILTIEIIGNKFDNKDLLEE